MKRVMVLMFFSVLIWGSAWGQPESGTIELSTSPSFWSVKEKGDDESTEVLNVPVRFGYFLSKNFEIEPELTLTMPDESDQTGYLIMANLLCNFHAAGNAIPFLLAGAGYGNAMNSFSLAFDQDMGITAYNFGAGLKVFLNRFVALRAEYRFIKYSGEKNESDNGWNYRREVNTNIHNFLIGFSIVFKTGH